jgi:hypothetical protein
MTALIALAKMIRPWWRGIDPGYGDHIYADCPQLVREGAPREGVGWLNPYDDELCLDCFRRYDPAACTRRLDDEY